jgi:hypothetical protein
MGFVLEHPAADRRLMLTESAVDALSYPRAFCRSSEGFFITHEGAAFPKLEIVFAAEIAAFRGCGGWMGLNIRIGPTVLRLNSLTIQLDAVAAK